MIRDLALFYVDAEMMALLPDGERIARRGGKPRVRDGAHGAAVGAVGEKILAHGGKFARIDRQPLFRQFILHRHGNSPLFEMIGFAA